MTIDCSERLQWMYRMPDFYLKMVDTSQHICLPTRKSTCSKQSNQIIYWLFEVLHSFNNAQKLFAKARICLFHWLLYFTYFKRPRWTLYYVTIFRHCISCPFPNPTAIRSKKKHFWIVQEIFLLCLVVVSQPLDLRDLGGLWKDNMHTFHLAPIF